MVCDNLRNICDSLINDDFHALRARNETIFGREFPAGASMNLSITLRWSLNSKSRKYCNWDLDIDFMRFFSSFNLSLNVFKQQIYSRTFQVSTRGKSVLFPQGWYSLNWLRRTSCDILLDKTFYLTWKVFNYSWTLLILKIEQTNFFSFLGLWNFKLSNFFLKKFLKVSSQDFSKNIEVQL